MRLLTRAVWTHAVVYSWVGFCNPLLAQDVTGFKFLEVRVVDPDGKPMADVPVEFRIGDTPFDMPTGEEGTVAVNVPTADSSEVSVRVKHDAYTAMAVGWRGDKVPEQVTIPLTKGVSFGGIVHDEQGRPVEGAVVSGSMVWNHRHGLINDGKVVPYLDGELAKTGKDGKWQCTMAPEGKAEFQLNFSHLEFLDQHYRRLASWNDLTRQQTLAVLEKGVPLTGQLLDPDGNPASRMRLIVMQIEEGGYHQWETVTDEQGRFTTRPVRKGQATLAVENLDYAPLQKTVDVAPGIEPQLLQLDRGTPLRIKVLNGAGDPLAGATVNVIDWLYPNAGLNLGDNYSVNARGIWTWQHAPAEMLTYRIAAPGYRETRQQFTVSEEVQTAVLKPAIKITGNVIDKATRSPIENYKLIGIATIDCGVDERCLIAFGETGPTSPGEYDFRAGLLCKEFYISCGAEGYKNATTRVIKPEEDEIQWDFELEREDEKTQ